MLWKWVSNHRLFNVGSSTCLGLNISRPEQPLTMLECDSTQYSLWWNCDGKMLVGVSEFKLAVENNKHIVARKKSTCQWKQYMSYDEDLCEHPFQESGCDIFWKKNPNTHICYQFNLASVLSWREARAACQLQGGDLLSVTDPEEQNYISNLSKLIFSNFVLFKNVFLDISDNRFKENHCAVINPRLKYGWNSYLCESGLPFVCKKYLNETENEALVWQICLMHMNFVCSFKDTWQYYANRCDAGWYPHNRNCYRLHKEEKSWNDASLSCQSQNSRLISVSSMADEELLLNLLESEEKTGFITSPLKSELTYSFTENVTETWIGLYSNSTPVVFEWSDSTPVKFSNWHRQEPNTFQRTGQLCVSAQGPEGHWRIKKCEDKFFYICKKAGEFNSVSPELESNCPESYSLKYQFIYFILKTFLLIILLRFEQAFINSMIRNMAESERTYFWIGLQDLNNTGEYFWLSTAGKNLSVSYTNWNKYQPRHSGGCVAMRGEHPVGYWEVKSCKNFRAMSLCKQKVNSYEEPELTFQKYSSSCYFGWESEPNLLNCYKIFHNEKVLMRRTWDEAEALCQDFGAHLASFSHIYEETYLNNLLYTIFDRTEERQFWIGFNKRNALSGGTWQWSDRTPVTICLLCISVTFQVVTSFLEDKYLEDDSRNCGVFKVNRTVFPAHCNEKREWICKIPKGRMLINIIAMFVAFLWKYDKLSTSDVHWWIGLHAENLSDEFRSAFHIITWILPKIFNCFLIQIPKDPEHLRNWYSAQEFCSNYGGSLAILEDELEQDTSRHFINASDMYPVPDTLEYGNRIYKLLSGNFTWSSALQACMANSAELVSITDQYHQAFLTIMVNRLGYSHWIGLFTSDNGLNFEWSDGTRSLFTFWEDDESQAFGSCVYIDTSGHWKSANCEQPLQGAVCHVPSKKKLNAYKGLCSEKTVPWIKFKNSCYSFSTVLQGMSFDTAYEVCKNQDIDTTESSEKASYGGLVALAVLVTLVMLAAISLFLWCLHKENNQLFRRILWVRNAYLPQINADSPSLEESILISDFERSENN
ncbi:Secretory phospholipase A2 receptor [Lonchura striata]|uniref:Secretory phospholipase A2 receptor n=1 Tax=Lonchura striata TaxID=40157 RepID=A0A218VB20_9PASE|nr:Secretory phospholipase A2 receptor [Lonchura striata domestica]